MARSRRIDWLTPAVVLGLALLHCRRGHWRQSRPTVEEEFLFHEYEAIETDVQRLRTEGATRLNILVAIATAVLTGFAASFLVSGVSQGTRNAVAIAALGSTGLFTMLTYSYFVGREILTDRDFRALARIRRYFVQRERRLVKFVTRNTTDGPTNILLRNHSFVLVATRTLLAIITAIATADFTRRFSGNLAVLAAVTAAGFVVPYGGARWWSSRRFHAAAQSASKETRFTEPVR